MMADAKEDALESDGIGGIYRRLAYGAGMILAVAVLGAILAVRFANSEYRRDLRNWEIRIGMTADARAFAAEQWIGEQFEELGAVADNMSLRLYLTELSLSGGDRSQVIDEPAQMTFLRNYLDVTAARAGFAADATAPRVNANVPALGISGVALLDKEGRLVAATAGMPKLDKDMLDFVASAPRAERALRDIYAGEEGRPMITFAAPVFQVQGDPVPDQRIGTVIGIRPVDDALYPLLERPRSIEETAETVLVRERDGTVEYISPLKDGTPALKGRMAKDTPDSDAAFALADPGASGVKRDYALAEVLMTSRRIAGTPWTLIHKIGKDEALAESEQRRASFISIGLLAIVMLVFAIFAVWRHGSSVRYKALAAKFKSQERLLRLVADNQPDAVFILDKSNRYCFANRVAAQFAGAQVDAMQGKKIKDVIGKDNAVEYQSVNGDLLQKMGSLSHIRRIRDDRGQEHIVQSKFVYLERVPHIITKDVTPGMLVVEQDITAAITEREKREQSLSQLVDKLVTIMDQRDAFAAQHSTRVSEVAEAIAREMALDDALTDTAAVAGKLMNIGKILAPPDLLMKKGKITEKDRKEIAASITSSADLLDGLEFRGPVVETIRQAQEQWDGTGPLGLEGNDILVTARVVAVANAFVAMMSPRAYRSVLSRDEAMRALLAEVEKKFDRRVVVAFLNYLETHEDAFDWLSAEA